PTVTRPTLRGRLVRMEGVQAVPKVWVSVRLSSFVFAAALAPVSVMRTVHCLLGKVPVLVAISPTRVVEPTEPRSRVWPATALKLNVASVWQQPDLTVPVPGPAIAIKRNRPLLSVVEYPS